MQAILSQGAEATLYRDRDTVVKVRHAKGYRHQIIDKELRQFRTRREAKVLEKLAAINFPSPALQEMNDTEMKVTMSFIPGEKVRDVLHTNSQALAKEIGRKVGILHTNNIIHGDLTTSNMILHDEIHFIDFGLSFFSQKIEDKAVDLHLLKQALEAKHFKIAKEAIKIILDNYKADNHKEIIQRIKTIESRGRYRH